MTSRGRGTDRARGPGVLGGRSVLSASTVALAVTVALLVGPGTFGISVVAPSHAAAPLGAPSINDTPYVRHIVLIVLENEGLTSVWGHGPYERYLAATYGNATHFYAACHPSAGNYI
ncbi:MAG: hypothetical protein L3K08_04495, partial [Thermoplasmata archaeon]|nr:hypothetical protein [Thermoplasmata archaeon]